MIDKKGQGIPDTPENFAVLSYILLEECLLFYKNKKIQAVIFDKHFHREADQQRFNAILLKLLGEKLKIVHLDSSQNPEVNAADMVAGSVLWQYTDKDKLFYKLIKEKIVSEKILNWKQARARFFAEIKTP